MIVYGSEDATNRMSQQVRAAVRSAVALENADEREVAARLTRFDQARGPQQCPVANLVYAEPRDTTPRSEPSTLHRGCAIE